MFLSKYGVARHLYLPIVKRAVVDFAVGADWTPAAGDVKISKDGGAFANVTNLPTVIASANTGAVWDFSLTATEMQAAQVVVVVSDAATKAVEDQTIIVETYGHASAQHEVDFDAPGVTSVAAAEITAVPAVTASLVDKVNWLFELARNKRTQTATTETVFKDDGTTTLATSTKSDSAGTMTRGEYA